jgi:uncharacterized coiled-coil protein SlyX
MAYNCEQRIDELERLLIANQDCVDNVVDAYLQLEAEVAELKAKLEEKDILIYNLKQLDKSMDANVNAYIAKLESQLAAQDWHDASELPTEEGYYAFSFDGIWAPIDPNLFNLEEALIWREEIMGNPDYSNIKWKHITLPEGK